MTVKNQTSSSSSDKKFINENFLSVRKFVLSERWINIVLHSINKRKNKSDFYSIDQLQKEIDLYRQYEFLFKETRNTFLLVLVSDYLLLYQVCTASDILNEWSVTQTEYSAVDPRCKVVTETVKRYIYHYLYKMFNTSLIGKIELARDGKRHYTQIWFLHDCSEEKKAVLIAKYETIARNTKSTLKEKQGKKSRAENEIVTWICPVCQNEQKSGKIQKYLLCLLCQAKMFIKQ